MFDDDIREAVDRLIGSGEAREFSEIQPVFDTVEKRFPAGLNRIAWEKVRSKQHEEVFPVATGGKKTEDIEARLSARRERVRSWLRDESILADEEVVWVGDSADFGLCMTVGTLLEWFPRLFSLPQHSYALPRDGSWCLNYVMEGELFFARACKP